jgi:hypothetical protein
MVNITLPINIGADTYNSSIEVLGLSLQYSENPVPLETDILSKIDIFRSIFQFREGNPQETVDVSIQDRTLLVNTVFDILKTNTFITDMSVEQSFVDHISEAFAVELSKHLGLNAIGSFVEISNVDALISGISEGLVSNIESSSDMRQYLYEQYLQQSPDRFPPGADSQYAPIPFSEGDAISFFLTLTFGNTTINGNSNMKLSHFLLQEEIPVVKFVVKFYFY